MSVNALQSRIIQNTRPDGKASDQPIEKTPQPKPDTQNLHAAPGAPAEPPDDPNKISKPKLSQDKDYRHCDMQGADFSNLSLEKATFIKVNLQRANFDNANLKNANFCYVDLSNANLRSANLGWTYFEHSNLTNANLDKSIIARANFGGINLSNANFSNVKAIQDDRINCEAKFQTAIAPNANFTNAVLGRAMFSGANLKGSILSVASRADGIDLPNELFLSMANLDGAQIFLDLIAKEMVHVPISPSREDYIIRLPAVMMHMPSTSLQGATIVNMFMFPLSFDDAYRSIEAIESNVPGEINLRNAYLRNVSFINQEIFNNYAAESMQGCRVTPDTILPEGFDYQAAGLTIIPITDWSGTNLKHRKFDKQFLIQSTMNKTKEEADKIKSLDLSGADCSHADFKDFHQYMTLCKWQGANIEEAKGVHKFMILQGAKGNPQRPVFGFKSDAEAEAILRRAKAGEFREEGK